MEKSEIKMDQSLIRRDQREQTIKFSTSHFVDENMKNFLIQYRQQMVSQFKEHQTAGITVKFLYELEYITMRGPGFKQLVETLQYLKEIKQLISVVQIEIPYLMAKNQEMIIKFQQAFFKKNFTPDLFKRFGIALLDLAPFLDKIKINLCGWGGGNEYFNQDTVRDLIFPVLPSLNKVRSININMEDCGLANPELDGDLLVEFSKVLASTPNAKKIEKIKINVSRWGCLERAGSLNTIKNSHIVLFCENLKAFKYLRGLGLSIRRYQCFNSHSLNYENDSILDQSLRSIASLISEFKELENLDLNMKKWGQYSGTCMNKFDMILQQILQSENLRKLKLEIEEFATPNDLLKIFTSVGCSLTSLQSLHLYTDPYLKIVDNVIHFTQMLGQYTKITQFYIKSDNFTFYELKDVKAVKNKVDLVQEFQKGLARKRMKLLPYKAMLQHRSDLRYQIIGESLQFFH